jgi:RND family efflux transporter MFP subunit
MRTGGRLTEVNVQPGDSVKKGQVLARLDPQPLENALRDATAQLEQARFKLDKAKRAAESGTDLAAAGAGLQAAWLGVVSARGNYSSTLLRADVTSEVRMAKFWADFWADDLGNKWLRLNENPNSDSRRIQYEEAGARSAEAHARMLKIQQDADNNVTAAQKSLAAAQQAYLSALSNYNTLKSGDPVREAELDVLLNETEVTRAQVNLEGAMLVAPFDGVVLDVQAQVGQTVAANSKMVQLVDPTALQVKSTVVEEDYPLVQAGQTANLFFDARPEVDVQGRVARVVPQREAGSSPTYPIYIEMDQVPDGLAAGMTVDASLVVAKHSNVLRLPRSLVRARSDGTGQVKVWAGDHTEERTVKVGLRGDQYVEIVDGLREGEQVVSK